jgi:hypothetical protein
MKTSRWFISWYPPLLERNDDLPHIRCAEGTTLFYATSRTNAMKQYRDAVKSGGIPKRCIIYRIGVYDEDGTGMMRRWDIINGRAVPA